MKPKLLWHSNAPWTQTGYGAQTGLFLPKLAEEFDVAASAFWGLEGNLLPWNGIPVLPGIGQTHGNETILDHARVHFGPELDGLVCTLMDVWVLDPQVWSQLDTICWVPIDHEPLPPPIAAFFHDSNAVPMAMSKFGERQLRGAGLDPLYCPHGIDCDVYRPVEDARKVSGMPEDAFIVGMVAANKGNPSRKCFAEAFQAFKRLHEKHSDARLYLHTEISGRFDGVNLLHLIDTVGLDHESVIFADQYRVTHYPFPLETMAAVYSSLDVLLMPSAGEGFGIPAIEAQACGTPVIASDFSAQPELVGSGWTVSGRRVYTPLKAFQFLPDVDDIAAKLEIAYSKRGNMAYSVRAREHAEKYHLPNVVEEFMLPALQEARERFDARKPLELAA